MGGVDICDQMLEYYRSFYETKKWPVKVILHLFDLAIVNSWQEYRQDHAGSGSESKRMQLLGFRLELGEYLITGTKKRTVQETNVKEDENPQPATTRRQAALLPCDDKRYDGFEHWPSNDQLKDPLSCRNRGCHSHSRIRCIKCNVYLCMNKSRNCLVIPQKKN
ncbi:hypothetical protein JTB14_010384 [Gonioctena quinquepunctata]|nr:hypothetical protein JTB14_010384 [Gonioctena quinquepunctata]